MLKEVAHPCTHSLNSDLVVHWRSAVVQLCQNLLKILRPELSGNQCSLRCWGKPWMCRCPISSILQWNYIRRMLGETTGSWVLLTTGHCRRHMMEKSSELLESPAGGGEPAERSTLEPERGWGRALSFYNVTLVPSTDKV